MFQMNKNADGGFRDVLDALETEKAIIHKKNPAPGTFVDYRDIDTTMALVVPKIVKKFNSFKKACCTGGYPS